MECPHCGDNNLYRDNDIDKTLFCISCGWYENLFTGKLLTELPREARMPKLSRKKKENKKQVTPEGKYTVVLLPRPNPFGQAGISVFRARAALANPSTATFGNCPSQVTGVT